jgi:hypothetical protein
MNYMYPNPNRPTITVNGRAYSAAADGAPVVVDPVDVPMLSANGWLPFNDFQNDEVLAFQFLATQAGTAALLSTAQALSQAVGASGNVAWNVSLGYKATLLMTGNANMVLPTNIPAAGRGILEITQNAASNAAITFNSSFVKASGANMTLTATNGAVDVFELEFDSTRIIVMNALKNVG